MNKSRLLGCVCGCSFAMFGTFVLLLSFAAPLRAELLYDWVGDFPLGGAPLAIIAADFNGDGHLDLAMPTINEQAVEVVLGDGTGSFGQNRRFPITSDIGRPRAIVTADFDRNGTLDLAVTTIQEFLVPNYVSVFLGAGNGSFGPETLFRVGTEPLSLAVADFNGDGVLDLVTANRFSDSISVLLGTGTGSFGKATNVATLGLEANALVVGKLNDDPYVDIVVANGLTRDVSVFLGDGAGSFAAPFTYAAGSYPFSGMALADLNNDGFLDLAVSNAGASTISILMGNGDGTFDPPRSVEVGASQQKLTLADLNQDHSMDLVVSKFSNGPQQHNEVVVLLGNGNGSFGAATTIYALPDDGIRDIEFEIADFNEDGVADFAFSKHIAFVGNFLSIYLTRKTDVDEFAWGLFLPAILHGARTQ